MAKIDEMVLSMDFDNSRFKRGAGETLSMLDNLKKNLNFDSLKNAFKGSTDSVQELQKQVQNVDLASMSGQLSGISSQWDVMGTVGRTAIFRITNAVMDLGGKLKGMVWDPIVQGGMNRAKNLEQANFMLQGIFSGEEQAASMVEKVMESANDAVTGTAYGLDAAAKAAAQFAATGMRGGEEMTSTLRGIAGVASMTSSEYEEISSIFTTISGQGRLMSNQLNQLATRGINAAATLAEHFGVTEGELRKMVTKGEVSFEDFAEAMDNAFGDQASKANETYTGALSNLRAALGRIGADVAGVQLEKMRDLFNALRLTVNAVHKALEPFLNLIMDRMVVGFDNVIGPINTFTNALEVFNKTGESTTSAWTGFFRFMQDLGLIIGLVADVIGDMIQVILGGTPTFIEMSNTMSSAGTKIQHIFRKLLSVIMLVPEIIGMILKEVFGLAGGAASLGDSILTLVDHMASWLYIAAENIRESKVLQAIVKTLGTAIRLVVQTVAALARGFVFLVGKVVGLLSHLSPVTDFFINLARVISETWISILNWEIPDIIPQGLVDRVKGLWDILRKFKIPKLNLREFTNFGGIVQGIVGWFRDLIQNMKELDFGAFREWFESLGGIGDWFANFEMPEFNMDSFRAIREQVSQFAGGALGKLGGGTMDFALNIKSAGVKAFDFVRSIDYRGIYDGIKSGLTNALEAAVSGAMRLSEWIGNAIGNIEWASIGDAIGNGIVKAFTFITGAAGAITKFLADFFTNIFSNIDWEGMLEGLENIKENIQGSFKELGQAFRGETIDTTYLEDALGTATADISVNVIQDIGSKTQGIRETISDFFGALFGTGPDISAEDSELIQGTAEFGQNVKSISTTLASPFASAKTAITTEFTNFGATLKGAVSGLMEGVNLVELLNGIGLAFTGAGLFKLSESVATIASVPETLNATLTSLGTAFTSIGEAAKIEAQGNAILKIAASLAILAGAVWALSKIPWDQMKVGLGATLTLLGALVAAVVIMDKTLSEDAGEKLSSISTSMMQIGIAVGILAAAIYILGNMDFMTILQGLGTAILAIVALAGGALLAGMAKSVAGLGWAFIGLAAGVGILAGSFLLFKMINPEEIKKGLVTIAGALLAMSIAARVADGKKLAGAGMAMLGIGAGLLALSYGIKAIANLDADQLQKGLTVLAGVMVGITLMTTLGGGKLTATVGTLVGLSFALIALSYAIGLIANIDFWDAAGGMAVLVAGLAGLGLAMKAFPPTMPALAGSLLGIAGALAILIAAIWVIGNMEFTTVAQGMIVLGAALGGLFAVLKFLPKGAGASMGTLAVGMLALSASVLILAFSLKMLDGVGWGALVKGALVIGALIGVLAILAAIGTWASVGLSALGASLLVLGAGLVVIAASVWIFADAVSNLVDSMVILSENSENIKNALKDAGEGITLFADEAGDGLKKLMDVIGLTGVLKVGSLAKLFTSFGEIPDNMDVRLQALADGLTSLEEVTPTLESLKELGQSGSLKSFFEAFTQINPDSGASLQSLADTMRGFDDEFFSVIYKLSAFKSEEGDNKTLSKFFRAFDDLNPETGEKLKSLADTLRGFDDGFFTTLYKLSAFKSTEGDDQTLSKFFRAFDDLNPETGEKLKSLADTLRGFDDDFFSIIYKLSAFKSDEGSNQTLSKFFRAFDDLNPETGEKLGSLVNTLKLFDDDFFSIMDQLSNFESNEGRGKTLSKFFRAFDELNPETGEKLGSLVSTLKQFDEGFFTILTKLSDFQGDSSTISDFFDTLSDGVQEDMGPKLKSAASGMRELQEAVPELSGAIDDLTSLDVEGLSNIMANIEDAFSSGAGDALSNAADAIKSAVEAMLSAATDRTSEFRTAGEGLGDGLVEGVGSKEGDAGGAGEDLGNAAAMEARNARSKMVSSGEYIGQGLAQGIRNSQADAVAAARDMANAVAEAARVVLDERSPSRVFMEIGQFVSQGFALGITADGPRAQAAIIDTMDAAIKTMDGKTFQLKDSTKGFYDALINEFNNNPMTRRLEELGKHSEAAYATAIKERKIADAEEQERREDEKEGIYREIKEARYAIDDAKKAQREAEEKERDEKQTEKERARELSEAKVKIEDAEKRERRAIAAKDRYEYQMHGEEAGVAFVDGVAVGIIDNSDQLPSVAEIFSAVLLEELEYVKTQASDFIGVFEGLANVRTSFHTITDEVRMLQRHINRLGTATTARSYRRNMDMIIDSTLTIGKEIVGLMDVFDRFEPYLPGLLNQFNHMLPAIIPVVSQFAPGLAATLGGGLASALPAIAGPVAGIIGAIAGIGIFLYDMANDQVLLKLIRQIFFGVITFIRELPEKLPRLIRMLLRGFVNLVKELPKFIGELAVAIIEAIVEIIVMIPEILPELIVAIVDAIIEIVTILPVALVQASGAIIKALIKGVYAIVVGLLFGIPRMFFEIGVALVDGVIRGVRATAESLFNVVRSLFTNVVDIVKLIFGIRSPSKVFRDIGQEIMNGLGLGVDDKAGGVSDKIRDAIRKFIDELDDGPEGTLTITPVIDTSEALKGLEELGGQLGDRVLWSRVNYDAASDIAAVRSEEEALRDMSERGDVTNINYTQNNTSPQPLSAIEIYRNTRKQLEMME